MKTTDEMHIKIPVLKDTTDIALEGLGSFDLPEVGGKASAPRIHIADNGCQSCSA